LPRVTILQMMDARRNRWARRTRNASAKRPLHIIRMV
jgi:hypothetical protein